MNIVQNTTPASTRWKNELTRVNKVKKWNRQIKPHNSTVKKTLTTFCQPATKVNWLQKPERKLQPKPQQWQRRFIFQFREGIIFLRNYSLIEISLKVLWIRLVLGLKGWGVVSPKSGGPKMWQKNSLTNTVVTEHHRNLKC